MNFYIINMKALIAYNIIWNVFVISQKLSIFVQSRWIRWKIVLYDQTESLRYLIYENIGYETYE